MKDIACAEVSRVLRKKSSSSAQYVRPLGAQEEFFWLLDQESPVHFATVAEINGTITLLEWRYALDALQERHPLLSVCIDSTYNSVPHFRHVEGQRVPLRVVEDSEAWEYEVEQELRTLFLPEQAPLLRAVLLHKQRKSIIILVTHHAIADGMAVVFLMRDLFTALAGKPLERLKPTASRDQLFGYPVRTSSEAGTGALFNAGAISLAQVPVSVYSRKIPSHLTAELRVRSRREGTTIHGILCAAIAYAGHKLSPYWSRNPIRIYSTISCRELLGLKDQCMVAFTSMNSVIDHSSQATAWDIARNLRTSLSPFLTRSGIQASLDALNQAVLSNLTPADAYRMLIAAEAMVTNLGQLPFQSDFGRFTLESFWAPCVLRGFRDEQIIGASTLDGVLHLVQTSRQPLPNLLEEIERQLLDACTASPS